MEEERLFNENVFGLSSRQRTISSPVPHGESHSRPLSPGGPIRCYACGQLLVSDCQIICENFRILPHLQFPANFSENRFFSLKNLIKDFISNKG
jgi:hypothetical protein